MELFTGRFTVFIFKEKEDITRKKILDDYGISEREANKLLGDDYDKVSEQFL